MWQREFSIVANASAEKVWQLFADVEGWPRWNAGIERIAMDGPFAAGTAFEMKVPGQEPLHSTLLEVVPLQGFKDETVVGDIRVVVDHRLHALPEGGVCVTYSATVTGPDAGQVGAMVTEDFPQVLAALAEAAAASR